jgi:hypothetical protein
MAVLIRVNSNLPNPIQQVSLQVACKQWQFVMTHEKSALLVTNQLQLITTE